MKMVGSTVAGLAKQVVGIAFSREARRRALASRLFVNSLYLMINSAAGAALGAVFWVLAARLHDSEDVGLGSALVSAAGLLAFLAGLGLGTGLIRFLPGTGARRGELINSCFTISGVAAIALSLVFLAGLPLWSPALRFVRGDPLFAAAFVAGVAAIAVSSLLSDTFVALRRAKFSLILGLCMALVRLVAVLALGAFFQSGGIFAAWGVAAGIGVALSVFLFLPRLQLGYWPRPMIRRQASNEMVRFSFANYVSTGLWNAPTWVLPLIIVNTLGGEANAYFYVAWGLAALLFAIPTATSISLFAEGSHQRDLLARDVRRSLKFIAVLLVPAVALMVLAGSRLLLLFGHDYSSKGTHLLWVLAPSSLAVGVNVVYLAIARVEDRLKDILLLSAAVSGGTLLLSYLLVDPLGIIGAGLAWLICHCLVAAVVLPKVIATCSMQAVPPETPTWRVGDSIADAGAGSGIAQVVSRSSWLTGD